MAPPCLAAAAVARAVCSKCRKLAAGYRPGTRLTVTVKALVDVAKMWDRNLEPCHMVQACARLSMLLQLISP